MRTVSAVILTYNRKELLAQCLEAITGQSRPVDRIIVVDNAGTDGTVEWLTQEWGDRIELYRLPKNVGASGGFHTLMRIGYERGDDAIWVMDDDVIPAPDALERLVEAEEKLASRNIVAPFVISTAWTPDGELNNVPAIDGRRDGLSSPKWPALLGEGLIPVRRATFVSMLLKREAMREHGLPISEMFMWSEDTEYTRRLTSVHPGWLVGASRVLHIRSAPGVLDIRTEHDPARIANFFYLRRNRMYLKRRNGWGAAARVIYQQSRRAVQLLSQGETRKARIVIAGTWAGLFFDPKVPGVDTPCDLDRLRVRGHAAADGHARAA